MATENFILAEVKGTYRAPHPDGIRDANVTKDFHVKVKMEREWLNAPGLNGFFATYYKEHLKRAYPEMIDLYMFSVVQATELDGTPIHEPKAMSHDQLLEYIAKKKYPINPLLFSSNELRNEVILYEADPSGQQHLQGLRERRKGSVLATAAKLQEVGDLMEIIVQPNKEESAKGQSVEALLTGAKKK